MFLVYVLVPKSLSKHPNCTPCRDKILDWFDKLLPASLSLALSVFVRFMTLKSFIQIFEVSSFEFKMLKIAEFSNSNFRVENRGIRNSKLPF